MYNKTKVQELAVMFVRSDNEEIFKELLDELHWMIDTQLRKKYASLHNRAAERITRIKEDHDYRSKINIDNVEKKRAGGFGDDDFPYEEQKLPNIEEQKGKSTLKERLDLKKKKYRGVIDKAIIRREQSHPILDICKKCKLLCKKHEDRGTLTFQCFEFTGLDSKEEMRGEKMQVGRELKHTKKKPRTHILVTQPKVSIPWKEDDELPYNEDKD